MIKLTIETTINTNNEFEKLDIQLKVDNSVFLRKVMDYHYKDQNKTANDLFYSFTCHCMYYTPNIFCLSFDDELTDKFGDDYDQLPDETKINFITELKQFNNFDELIQWIDNENLIENFLEFCDYNELEYNFLFEDMALQELLKGIYYHELDEITIL